MTDKIEMMKNLVSAQGKKFRFIIRHIKHKRVNKVIVSRYAMIKYIGTDKLTILEGSNTDIYWKDIINIEETKLEKFVDEMDTGSITDFLHKIGYIKSDEEVENEKQNKPALYRIIHPKEDETVREWMDRIKEENEKDD